MKKLSVLIGLVLVGLLAAPKADAQLSSLWKVVSGRLSPVKDTWPVDSKAGFSGATAVTFSHLRSCNTLDTNANGVLSCGTDEGGSGAANEVGTASFSGAVRTVADTRYLKIQGGTMTGALTIDVTGGNLSSIGLKVLNAFSGAIVHAEKTLTTSGTLIFEGAASGSSLYIASQLNGAGLSACTGGNKLLWSSGRFSCAADIDTDTNTTYTPGQGLSLTSTAFSVNSTLSGTLARFLTLSGALLKAKDTLASSGTLVWEGAGSGNSLTISDALTLGKFKGCNLDTDANGALVCGSDADTNTTYAAAQGLSLVSGNFRLNASHSGTTVWATNTLASSGTLIWENIASGSSLYVQKSLSGAGLSTCTGGNKLLWSGGRFSCAADVDTNTTYTAGQNLALNGTAFSLNTTITGSLLEFTTVSGATTYGKNSIRSSGSLVWEGAASGATLYVATSVQGSGLVDCDLATQTLAWDASTGRFSCGTDSDTTYTAGQNLTLTSTSFRLNTTITGSLLEFATVSGTTVYGQQSLHSSGSLVWEGAASGASLYVATSLRGSGLTDCDTSATSKLLWDTTTGRFSCGTDQTGAAGGLTFAAAEGIYVNQAGDTMTGALNIILTGGAQTDVGLESPHVMSGYSMRVNGGSTRLESMGLQIFDRDSAGADDRAFFGITGDASSYYLFSDNGNGGMYTNVDDDGSDFTMTDHNGNTIFEVQADASPYLKIYKANGSQFFHADIANGRLGIGTASPKADLSVIGTMSGQGLVVDGVTISTGSTIPVKIASTASNTVTNTTSETNFTSNYIIPANSVKVGDAFRVTATGTGQSTGVADVTLRLKLGSTVLSSALSTAGGGTTEWAITGTFTIRAIGASGFVYSTMFYDDAKNVNCYTWCSGIVSSGATVNLTSDQTLQVSAQYSDLDSDDSITLNQFIIEKLTPVR